MNDQTIEQEIQEKGLTAPRVTPADIEANIASEVYFVGADAVRFGWLTVDGDADHRERQRSILDGMKTSSYSGACLDIDANAGIPESLKLLTFCVLVLRNGFTCVGKSACASPENFDAEIGRKAARVKAIDEVWNVMGYELRSRLTVQPVDEPLQTPPVCPHAAPFTYCAECVADPCPVGLGKR